MGKAKGLSFGEAIDELKGGSRVARAGWNGKNMFLVLVEESKPTILDGSAYFDKAGLKGKVKIDAHIDMYTASGTMQPGWLASQADMLSSDWCIVI